MVFLFFTTDENNLFGDILYYNFETLANRLINAKAFDLHCSVINFQLTLLLSNTNVLNTSYFY